MRKLKRKKILVVEDSKITRDLVGNILEEFPNVDVHKAETGFKALKAIPSEGPFDLIITDINMPDLNGLELIKFLKNSETYNHIPVIIISTEGKKSDIEKGFALGVNDYIVKPFTPEKLIKSVEKFLKE